MLENNNGFTLIEVLIASSLILMLVTIVVPISTVLVKERDVLSDRRIFTSLLQDELQQFLWGDETSLPTSYQKQLESKAVHFHFIKDGEFIKGCAQWENIKKYNETSCLYGKK